MNNLNFAAPDSDALPLTALIPETLSNWLETAPEYLRNWVASRGFKAGFGACLVWPDEEGQAAGALVGLGDQIARKRKRFALAAARARLDDGVWALTNPDQVPDLENECLGWLLAGYRFGNYASASSPGARLVAPEDLDADALTSIASGEALTRDLINTPANDMGPQELETAARKLAENFKADISVVQGDDLTSQNFPLIHTVGAASPRAPRLIEINHGDQGPKVTLVGKGVCFDTGGLNLKPGASMGLMKKDMGGAATVLGLTQMILSLGLKLRLRVLIPAVENAVSGKAFRPGDIYLARDGQSVEINNTDAEGRLVLADALAYAIEDKPDLLVSMATLTGAARVAVGPDLAPFFTDDDTLAATLDQSAASVADPVWRLPFWDPYEAMIEPGIADLDNAPKGGMAGSITAALFLRRFVGDALYLHFDIYGWQPSAAPARPKGGVGQGARALLRTLQETFS